MTFADTVVRSAKFVHFDPVHRWILKPTSLVDVSVHARTTLDAEAAEAVNAVGAEGAVPVAAWVVADAVSDHPETSAFRTARTRYE